MSSELEMAAETLRALVDCPREPNRDVRISPEELEAITFAAAFLGVFVEAIEAEARYSPPVPRLCPVEDLGIIEMGACTVCGYVPDDQTEAAR